MVESKVPGLLDGFESQFPTYNEPSVKALFEYERHYLSLLRDYQQEIDFINNKLKEYREEQLAFFDEKLPSIKKKLENENIDSEVINAWIMQLVSNMNRSFSVSEKLITEFQTKKLDEFRAAVDERMRSFPGNC